MSACVKFDKKTLKNYPKQTKMVERYRQTADDGQREREKSEKQQQIMEREKRERQ